MRAGPHCVVQPVVSSSLGVTALYGTVRNVYDKQQPRQWTVDGDSRPDVSGVDLSNSDPLFGRKSTEKFAHAAFGVTLTASVSDSVPVM